MLPSHILRNSPYKGSPYPSNRPKIDHTRDLVNVDTFVLLIIVLLTVGFTIVLALLLSSDTHSFLLSVLAPDRK